MASRERRENKLKDDNKKELNRQQNDMIGVR